MASAAFHFAAGASLAKYAASAAEVIPLVLDSVDGVRTIVWSVQSTDETSAGEWTVTNPTSITGATLTAPAGADKACIVSCVVNGGTETDARTGQQVAGDLRKTAKAYIADEVVAVGEVNESDATYGWAPLVNDAIRGGGGGAGTVTPDPNELVLRDGTGQAFATAFRGPAAAGTSLQSQAGQAVAVTGATGATLTATTGAAAIAAGAGAVTLTATGATSDITLDAGRDVIVDVGSTADEISIRANNVVKATITPGVSAVSVFTPGDTSLGLTANGTGEASLIGRIASIAQNDGAEARLRAGAGAISIGDGDLATALTITPNGSGGTTTIAGFQPLAISAAGAMTVQPAQATAGAGRDLTIGGGAGQTPGTHLAGRLNIEQGVVVSGSGNAPVRFLENGVETAYIRKRWLTGGMEFVSASSNWVEGASVATLFSGGEARMYANARTTTQSPLHETKDFGGNVCGEQRPVAVNVSASGAAQLATYNVPANTSWTVVVFITVANRTNKRTSSFLRRFVMQNNAGTGSDNGADVAVVADSIGAGEAGLTVTLDRSGTTVRLNRNTPDGDTREFRGVVFVFPSSLV